LRLVRHNTWANLRLLELCGALAPEQLEWTTPGTFGTLHRTLHHIVGAEHGYLLALTGELPPIEAEGRGKPMSGGWAAPIGELVERASSNGDRIERFVSSGFDPLRVIHQPHEPGSGRDHRRAVRPPRQRPSRARGHDPRRARPRDPARC